MKKPFKISLIVLALLVLYFLTVIPVGLFLYSVKSDLGINMFTKGGFHSYMHCLRQEAYNAQIAAKNDVDG
jgi:hypothetical protein